MLVAAFGRLEPYKLAAIEFARKVTWDLVRRGYLGLSLSSYLVSLNPLILRGFPKDLVSVA